MERVIKLAKVLFIAVNIQLLEVAAEPRDPKSTVQELADLTTDMTQFAAIVRLSEDISFLAKRCNHGCAKRLGI